MDKGERRQGVSQEQQINFDDGKYIA